MVIEIGRLCVKLRGREAGRRCVVVDILDENFVIIDGDIKRRRANIKHLEPLPVILNIKQGASTEEVIKAMLENKIPVSYWKLKRDNLLNQEIIELYKSSFGEDWERIAKELGSPGKRAKVEIKV
ncbi:50S ribosomal protein L14e [Nanoarchaeota archaeon NZ13-N]|uniref:50S ribosomal protein L14e n=1 Tax=Candidatus Nanoclepta minutus TaxID=1940235 RepID=A0A397WMD1_9ARCH|nr:MAG: 50S ribosomal protein L14e [Nanoarchaeota archaeon NZ13-N]RIB35244.1 MAG: 50S ribosomal protein L14e [Candidatus Nanoclepta minutus]